jgi:hypothetical protein
MARPTFDSLKIHPQVGQDVILFKEAQAAMPGAGAPPPDVGQSPVTGNPDEMQAPESANQRQFEDDFGSLAYQFIEDRAPALIPYLLGFEVVDRNDDGSKAVGIFGYKIDDDFYYIPAFFLNNQVRGVDMILNKKTNQFVPLTEKWIDFIVNKHSIRIGSPASNEVRDTMRNPDLTFVQRPQTALGKLAEDSAPWTPAEAWEHIKEATAKLMSEDASFKEMFAGAVSKGAVEKTAESKYFKDFMEKVGGPECMSSFLKTMHDVDFANAYLSLYKDAEAVFTDKLVNASIHVDRMRKIAEARPKVRVVDSTEGLVKASQDTPPTDVGEEDKQLSTEENARQIVEHDFTIEDTRKDDETAKVTDDKALVDFEHRFQPPDGPGRYNFMMSDGMSREGIMLNAVMSPSCDKDQTLFVIEDDGNVLAVACSRAIVATEFSEDSNKDDSGDDLKKLYDKAVAVSDIEIGGVDPRRDDGKPYLFLDDKGNAAGPFYIKFSIADGDHIRFGTGYGSDAQITTSSPAGLSDTYGFMDWNLEDRYHDFDGHLTKRRGECNCPFCESCGSSDFLTLGTFEGMPKKTSAGVIIPKNWKALPLKVIPRYAPYIEDESTEKRKEREAKFAKERADMESKYTFASAMDILETMKSEGIERIKVASDGTDFYVVVDGAKRRHGPMNYKKASVDLVTRFGFRPRRAFSTLAKAASAGEVMLLVQVPSLKQTVKQAQDALVNVAMPAPLEQIPSVDPYTGVPVYQSPYVDMTHGQFTGVPGLPPEGGMTRGINIGGEMERNMGAGEYPDEHNEAQEALPIDEEAKRLAQEAAAAGQRHVFDQAAIGGLVKVYDTANVVDSYIPDFMDTIDRLGRILFLFYWKHEDFNQRYGSDDVVQMEDSLRNVFKNLGELTLHLKEKAVQKE